MSATDNGFFGGPDAVGHPIDFGLQSLEEGTDGDLKGIVAAEVAAGRRRGGGAERYPTGREEGLAVGNLGLEGRGDDRRRRLNSREAGGPHARPRPPCPRLCLTFSLGFGFAGFGDFNLEG